MITSAISTGVPLFNSGDAAGCAAVYVNTVVDLLDIVSIETRSALSEVLDRSSACGSDHERAWLLRHTLDETLAKLHRNSEAGTSSSARPDLSMASADQLHLATLRWSVVDDRVMGGRSQSRVLPQPDGSVVFSGEFVVTGGGFASVRANLPSQGFGLRGCRGMVLQCNGDGRAGYKMIVKTDTAFDGIMYQASFDAPPASASFTLPLSSFRPTFRGQPVANAPALRGDAISVIGFMLSRVDAAGRYTDEPTGPFSLTVASLSGC